MLDPNKKQTHDRVLCGKEMEESTNSLLRRSERSGKFDNK